MKANFCGWRPGAAAALLWLWVAGCESDGEAGLAAKPDARAGATPLPSILDGEKHSNEPGPSLCEWAGSVDAIVFGEVREIRLVDTPAIEKTSDIEEDREDAWRSRDDDCPGTISPAVEIEVEVHETIRGDLEGRVTARVGNSYRGLWQPLPARGEDGGIDWLGADREDMYGEPLEVGQRLGLALHYLPEHDTWSVMSEPMFGLNAEGDIAFQGRHGVEPEPDIDERDLPGLAEAAASCEDSSAADERRDEMWQKWGPDGRRPTAYLAAWCIIPEEDPPAWPECESREECESDMRCIQGACQHE